MDLHFDIQEHGLFVVSLREQDQQTTVSVRPPQAAATSLSRALDTAMVDGYGECFWPGSEGGQYWWIFKRDAETLETVVLWTRGGASLWEHVFRATDAATWVEERLRADIARLGLEVAPRPDRPGAL